MLLHVTRTMLGVAISKAAALPHPAAWAQHSVTQDIEQAEHMDKLGPLRTSLPSTARKADAHTPTSPPGAELIQVVIAGSAEEDPSRLFSPASRTQSEASTAETIHRVRPRIPQRQHEWVVDRWHRAAYPVLCCMHVTTSLAAKQGLPKIAEPCSCSLSAAAMCWPALDA